MAHGGNTCIYDLSCVHVYMYRCRGWELGNLLVNDGYIILNIYGLHLINTYVYVFEKLILCAVNAGIHISNQQDKQVKFNTYKSRKFFSWIQSIDPETFKMTNYL